MKDIGLRAFGILAILTAMLIASMLWASGCALDKTGGVKPVTKQRKGTAPQFNGVTTWLEAVNDSKFSSVQETSIGTQVPIAQAAQLAAESPPPEIVGSLHRKRNKVLLVIPVLTVVEGSGNANRAVVTTPTGDFVVLVQSLDGSNNAFVLGRLPERRHWIFAEGPMPRFPAVVLDLAEERPSADIGFLRSEYPSHGAIGWVVVRDGEGAAAIAVTGPPQPWSVVKGTDPRFEVRYPLDVVLNRVQFNGVVEDRPDEVSP